MKKMTKILSLALLLSIPLLRAGASALEVESVASSEVVQDAPPKTEDTVEKLTNYEVQNLLGIHIMHLMNAKLGVDLKQLSPAVDDYACQLAKELSAEEVKAAIAEFTWDSLVELNNEAIRKNKVEKEENEGEEAK